MPATPIASLDDRELAPYRELADADAIVRAGLFVAEGRWVVQRLLALPRARYVVRSVLVTPQALAALTASVTADQLAQVPVYVVDPVVMTAVVGFHLHRGCLALAERPPLTLLRATALSGLRRVLVLEGVNNPDNIGGLFRSALAFDVDLVVLGPGCGDPLYRKAIRTSMGATLDLPYAGADAWPEALDWLRAAGLHVLALTPAPDAVPLEQVPPPARVALVCGTESHGLTAHALARADRRVRIRTTDRVDSLNVTVAASIALHHLTGPHGR